VREAEEDGDELFEKYQKTRHRPVRARGTGWKFPRRAQPETPFSGVSPDRLWKMWKGCGILSKTTTDGLAAGFIHKIVWFPQGKFLNFRP
jgi:hypothetical protein